MGQLGAIGLNAVLQLVALHVGEGLCAETVQSVSVQRVETDEHHQRIAGILHGSGLAGLEGADSVGGAFLGEGGVDVVRTQQSSGERRSVGRRLAIQHRVDVGQGSGDGGEDDEVKPIPGCKSVFVARLPLDITEDELRDEFASVGPVVNVRWVNVKPTSPVCCCFVEYGSEDEAVAAVKAYHGAVGVLRAHGQLRVNLAPDRPLRKLLTPQPPTGEGDGDGGEEGEEGEEEGEGKTQKSDSSSGKWKKTQKGKRVLYEGDEAEAEPPVIEPPKKRIHIKFNDSDDEEDRDE